MKLDKKSKLTILAVATFMVIMGYKIFHKEENENKYGYR